MNSKVSHLSNETSLKFFAKEKTPYENIENKNRDNHLKKDNININDNISEKHSEKIEIEEQQANMRTRKLVLIWIILVVILAVIIVIVLIIKKSDYGADLVNPDCDGTCTNPYNIKVYSDRTLKSKLIECNYKKSSKLFNFALEAIKRHNVIRACYNAQPLMFNCEMMEIAQKYAESDPAGRSGADYKGEWMGENLFWSWGRNLTGDYPVDDWYKEKSNYNFKTGKKKGLITDFTQVIDQKSKEFGIGYYCKGRKCTVVGNYYPSENINYEIPNQIQDLKK